MIVVIITGGKQSQPSLPLDGFGLDLDRSWLSRIFLAIVIVVIIIVPGGRKTKSTQPSSGWIWIGFG